MPVQNTLSWADRIKAANDTKTSFEPVPLGRFDFFIKEASVAQGPKGEYVKYRASIANGPRANALVFEACYPNAEKIGYFLEFWHALGFTDEWFMTGTGPSTEQIAAALVNRPFSAEVFVRDDAKNDKNGVPYRTLRKFQPETGSAPVVAETAPAANNFAAAPAAPAPAAPAFGTPANTAGGSPWGAPVAAPVAVPEPTAPAPVAAPPAAAAPAVDPWNGKPAAAPAATGTPPNPFA